MSAYIKLLQRVFRSHSSEYNIIRKRKNILENMSIVLQGPVDFKYGMTIETSHTWQAIKSIQCCMPSAKIILSTWNGSYVPADIDIYKLAFSNDPGCMPRGLDQDSKPNNINRQIVSTLSGLRVVDTHYALKLRTDFIIKSTNFLKYIDRYPCVAQPNQIFASKVLVCMYGTRKPKGNYYTLPYHVSDFAYLGLTSDLLDLFTINLVSNDEFNYFRDKLKIRRGTFAVNRYNAEQSIILNFLSKKGVNYLCDYATDLNDFNKIHSDLVLCSNFVPLSFRDFGIFPLKHNLEPGVNIKKYTDYYTLNEWLKLYCTYTDTTFSAPTLDQTRILINLLRLTSISNDQVLSVFQSMGLQKYFLSIHKLISYVIMKFANKYL